MADEGTLPDWNSMTDATPQDIAAASVPPPDAPATATAPAVTFNQGGVGPQPPAPSVAPADQTPGQLSGEVPLPEGGTPNWDQMPDATAQDIAAQNKAPPPTTVLSKMTDFANNIGDTINKGDDKLNDIINRHTVAPSVDNTPDWVPPIFDDYDAWPKERPATDYADPMTLAHAGAAMLGAMGTDAQKAATTGAEIVGAPLYLLDKIGAPTTTYDYWNKTFVQPSKNLELVDQTFTDNHTERSGVLGQTAAIIGDVSTNMAEMVLGGLGGPAAEVGEIAPITYLGVRVPAKEVAKIIGDGLWTSVKNSRVPAAIAAAHVYDNVAQKTGDRQAAIQAALMSGTTQIITNSVAMGMDGPLAWRLITGGFVGPISSEFQRDVNNLTMPDNMQVPFSWKGLATATVTNSLMAGAFGHGQVSDPQIAVLRYNHMYDEGQNGNDGAKKTVDVINAVSHVDGLSKEAVDAGVHGVVVSSNVAALPHAELMANHPRYASIFNATQGGPTGVDPTTGEQIARDAYVKEVATNSAFNHYFKSTGLKGESQKLIAHAKIMMDTAQKTVPAGELELLSRWASYDQPSQLQFNAALRETTESKVAPDYVHDRYGGDFGPDGVPSEQAHQRDSARYPDSFDAYYKPSPKVEKALRDGGIHYYRMNDGRLAVRGGNSEYTTNVMSHVFDQTGEVALKPGETYAQGTDDTQQKVRPEVPAAGNVQGVQAGAGDQAKAGQPQQPNGQQDGDEGNGSGVGAGSQLGDEGTGHVGQAAEGVSARAAPVADALAKAGVSSATVTPKGEVRIAPDATPEQAQKAMDVAASDTGASNTEYPEPTPKEAAAGNYRKGGVTFPSKDGDVRMRIENPDGSVRKGSWGSRPLKGAHYGYIPDTVSADGQPLDVLATHNAHDDTRPIAVISQHDPKTGKFDELKVVMGAKSKGEAMAVYGRQYPTGMLKDLLPDGRDNITMMNRAKFSKFIKSGATDVPPHPVSGMPMLKLRDNAQFEGDTGNANMDDMASKVQAINAKHGTDLNYDRNQDTVTGQIPRAKAAIIHKSLSRIDGYAGSKVDGQPILKSDEAAAAGEAQASGGGHAQAVPAAQEPAGVQGGTGSAGKAARDASSGRKESVQGAGSDGIPLHEVAQGPKLNPAPRGIPEVTSDAPVFQEGKGEHPVSVVGVHYSDKAGLTELDPREAGTGSAGGERRRFGMGNFGRGGDPMGARTAFYVREDSALPPKEDAVTGTHPYEARLNNLYDAAADPQSLSSQSVNQDDFEEKVKEAGYDGFVQSSPPGMPAKHVAVVFDVKGNIPVKAAAEQYHAGVNDVQAADQAALDEEEHKAELVKKVGEKVGDRIKDKVKEAGEDAAEPYIKRNSAAKLTNAERAEALRKKQETKELVGETTRDSLKEKLGGGEGKDEETPRFMFGGEKSPVADKNSLETAKAMLEQGKSSSQIHLDTGWSRGADGKWRFEIDDSASKINPDFSNPGSDFYKALDSEHGVPLDQALDHKSLYEAYPAIRNGVRVKISHDLPEEVSAAFSPSESTIYFHPTEHYRTLGDQSIHSSILHESQHFVQEHEGHAAGGNTHAFMEPLIEQHDALVDQLKAFNKQLRESNAADPNFFETPEGRALREQIKQTRKALDAPLMSDYNVAMNHALKQYASLAGEVEARNTQGRMAMTAQERRAAAPEITEDKDFPRDAQLVRFGNGGTISEQRMQGHSPVALFEVAPDPHNKELSDTFAALPPERRTEITHDLNNTITPDILKAVGVKADHFLSTFGGYMDQVNPSLGAQFRDGVTPKDAYRAASAAGHVFNQDSVIVVGKGMGDQVGRVRIDMDGPKDYNAVSRLYGHLRETLGDKVGGFTGHDTGIDILNFDKGTDTAKLSDQIEQSLKSFDSDHHTFHVTHDTTEAKFITKEPDEHGESYQSWLPKDGGQALDVLRGRASEALDKAISAKPKSDAEVRADAQAHHEAISAHVEQVGKSWKGAPLHVLPDRASAPETVKPWLDHYLAPGETPAGMYHNGRVYLFSDSIHDEAHADQTVLHESVGHLGLRGTFGDRLNPFLDSIRSSIKGRPDYRALADTYRKAYSGMRGAQFQRAVTEEYLARMAESPSDNGVLSKFTAWVRGWAASHGMKVSWDDAQMRSLLGKVADDVRSGRVSVGGKESPQTLFSDQTGVATSTYHGAAGRGEVDENPDGSRELRIGTLKATLHPTELNGKPTLSVGELSVGSPSDLTALARFAQEEGATGVAIGKENVTKAQIEASGVPYKNRPGFYELASTEKLPDNPMFSLRNRVKGDPQTEAILDKTIDHSPLSMTPWDRMQKAMRDFRDNIQSGDTVLNLKQSWVDSAAVLDKYERHVNGGNLLDAAQSAYKAYHLSKNNEQITAGVLKLGVPEYRNGVFEAVNGRHGLLDILAPLYKTPDGKSLDRLFEGYAVAHRANELIGQTNADGTSKEQLLTQPEIDKLMSLDKQYPVFKKVLGDLQGFNKQLLDLAVDRGTMSKDVADMWKKNMYVPFYRSAEENEATQWRNGANNGVSGKKVTSRKLYGSERKIEPVIENIIKNTSSVLDKVYSNEAMRRIVGLTDGIGMERVKLPMQAIRMSSEEMIGLLHRAGIQVDTSNLTQDDLDTLTTIFRPSRPIGPDIVSVVENGKNIYYRVTDPLLLRAVSSMNSYDGMNHVLNAILGTSKKIFTVATTLDPRFMFRIMLKDAMQSWIQTGTNPNMFKYVGKNAKEIYTDGKFLNQLRIAGYNGNEYYKIHEVRDHLKELHGSNWSILDTPKNIYDAYKHVGWMSEQLSRINIARQTLDGGGSMAEAAWQGQNTLNWQKHGDSQFAQLIMRGAPFLNAHIQGLARIYDGAMGRDVTQNRSRAVTSFLLKTLSIAAASVALANHNEKDPRYERLPEQAKDLYWHFFVGNKHYALAKPFEVGALSASVPERVMRVLQGQDTKKQFVDAMGTVVGEMFGINPIPQIIKPLVEDWANKDMQTGLPIVSQRLQGLQPQAQYTGTTSTSVKDVAGALPSGAPDMLRSPVRLQHLTRGYTSSIGMYLLQMADAAVTATSKGAPPAPASRFGNAFAGSLAHVFNVENTDTDPRNRYIGAVYDAQKSADDAARTLNAAVKAGHIEDAKQVMANNKTALQYRNEIHAVTRQMGQMRQMEQQIYQSTTMSPQDKRAALDKINVMRTHLLDKVGPMLDMVNDYH